METVFAVVQILLTLFFSALAFYYVMIEKK